MLFEHCNNEAATIEFIHRLYSSGFHKAGRGNHAAHVAGMLQLMSYRRTVRDFSELKIPQVVLEDAIKAVGTAPSGANIQI